MESMTLVRWLPNVPVTFAPGDWGVIDYWTPRNSRLQRGQMLPLKGFGTLIKSCFGILDETVRTAIRYSVSVRWYDQRNSRSSSYLFRACELTLYEQVGAINCFPNQGVYVEPIFITKICDKDGNVIYSFTPKTNEAIDQITAFKTVRLIWGCRLWDGWSLEV